MFTFTQKRSGFTAIELLIVITIIGLLIAIVLASFETASVRARNEKRIANLQVIALALEEFYTACGGYPPTLDTTGTGGMSPFCVLTEVGTTIEFGDFLSELPPLPDPSEEYLYATFGISNGKICHNYHLGVRLEKTDGAIPEVFEEDADLLFPPSSYSWFTDMCDGSDKAFDGDDANYIYDIASFPVGVR